MALRDEELERYARHIVLKESAGRPGEAAAGAGAGDRRRRARRAAAAYLAAAGVGTLGIVDDDDVSLSNLQRQIVHDTASVGLAKTASAAASLARINPGVSVVEHPYRITADNAMD